MRCAGFARSEPLFNRLSSGWRALWCRSDSTGKDDVGDFDSTAVEIFIGGLPPDCKEEQVEQAFSLVGQVIGLRLNRRKRTGECKGFGFVRYSDQATAERACSEIHEVRHWLVCLDQGMSRSLVFIPCQTVLHKLQEEPEPLYMATQSYDAGLWQASWCSHFQRPQC